MGRPAELVVMGIVVAGAPATVRNHVGPWRTQPPLSHVEGNDKLVYTVRCTDRSLR